MGFGGTGKKRKGPRTKQCAWQEHGLSETMRLAEACPTKLRNAVKYRVEEMRHFGSTCAQNVGPATTQNVVVKFDGEICGGVLVEDASDNFPSKRSSKISFQTSPEVRHQFRRKLRQLHSGNRWCLKKSLVEAQCAHRKHCHPETPLGSHPTSEIGSHKEASGCRSLGLLAFGGLISMPILLALRSQQKRFVYGIGHRLSIRTLLAALPLGTKLLHTFFFKRFVYGIGHCPQHPHFAAFLPLGT